MRKSEAKKLHNRDQVEVRTSNGWEMAYVLGEPREEAGRIIVPVQTASNGWIEVDHTDVA
jgi:hypothetical protein